MPAIYQWREFTEAGGYMSFGPSIIEAYEQVGEDVAPTSVAGSRRIAGGAATRVELVITSTLPTRAD